VEEVDAGVPAPVGEAAVGDPCDIRGGTPADFCQAGLVCEFGACREACGPGGSCRGENEECIDFSFQPGLEDYAFCFETCDFYGEGGGCEEGEVCAAGPILPQGVIGNCGQGAHGEGLHGDECESPEGPEATYWGDCRANHFCMGISEERPNECMGFCDRGNRDLCLGMSVCSFGLLQTQSGRTLDDLGLCIGECDSITQEGCDEGTGCTFSFLGAVENGVNVARGFCFDAPRNPLPSGADCVRDPETFEHDCAAGHLCIGDEGEQTTCLRLCDAEHEDLCPEGTACAAGVFGDDAEIGWVGLCMEP